MSNELKEGETVIINSIPKGMEGHLDYMIGESYLIDWVNRGHDKIANYLINNYWFGDEHVTTAKEN